MIRVPSRYDILIMFCFAVLVAYGISYLFKKYDIQKNKKTICCVIISALILFEFGAAIEYQSVVKVPEFYSNISYDDDGYVILDIPFQGSPIMKESGNLLYDEYQTIHHKKYIGGYIVKGYPAYIKNTVLPDPVFRALYYRDNMTQSNTDNPFDFFYNKTGIRFEKTKPILTALFFRHLLSDDESLYLSSQEDRISNPVKYLNETFDIRYIIVHPNLMDNKDTDKIQKYLGNNFTIDNSVPTDPLIIYDANKN